MGESLIKALNKLRREGLQPRSELHDGLWLALLLLEEGCRTESKLED